MEDSIPDRYEKNPMLVVVENYVLDVLGKLEPEKAALLNEIVCRTFGGDNWREIVRREFSLSDDASLVKLWKQQVEEAEAQEREISVEDFAREVADGIFADLDGGDQDGGGGG